MGNIITPLSWFDVPTRHRRETQRQRAVIRAECPCIMAEVVESRATTHEPGGTEMRIVAIFRWPMKPERKTQLVLVHRLQLIDVHGSFDAAKLLVTEVWNEHATWGEEEELVTMWKLPVMTNVEMAAYRANVLQRTERAKERAKKTLEQRKQNVARTGGKVD